MSSTPACHESESASETEINMNVMELPNEIWQVIFELLSAKDLKSLRFVNKEWKNKIDEIATFSVEFHDGLPESILERLFQLRIRSCSFFRLQTSFEPRFDSPMLIKDVTFSNVPSESLTKILNTCTHVEKLKFFLTLGTDNLFDPCKDYSSVLHLRTLKAIDVKILTIGSRTPTSKSSTFGTLFVGNLNKTLHFDALEKLSIFFSMTPEEWIQLFEFIGNHARTLKSLEIRCLCGENGCRRSDFSEMSRIKTLKLLNLRSLNIRCDSISAYESNVHGIFDQIVNTQRSLETVSLMYYGLKFSLLVNILEKCKTTLRAVKLSGVEAEYGEICSGSSIGECHLLREFELNFMEKTFIVVLPPNCKDEEEEADALRMCEPVCSSVSDLSLPKSLVELTWEGLWIKTEEIESILESSDCPLGLRTLDLYKIGETNEFGLKVDTFLRICKKFPDLKKLRLGALNIKECNDDECKRWAKITQCATDLGIYESVFSEYNNTFQFSVFRISDKKEEFLKAITSEDV